MKIYSIDNSCYGKGPCFSTITGAIECLTQDFGDEFALDAGETISITCEEVTAEKWQAIQDGPEWQGW